MGRMRMREALLDAAEGIMATRRLSQITMQDIAEEAGVGKTEALHYFPGEKALMMGIIDRYEAKLFALRDRYFAEYPGGARNRLKAALMALAEQLHHCNFMLPNMLAFLSDREQWNRIAEIKVRLYEETCEGEDPEKVSRAMKKFDDIFMAETFAENARSCSDSKKAFGELMESLENEETATPSAPTDPPDRFRRRINHGVSNEKGFFTELPARRGV